MNKKILDKIKTGEQITYSDLRGLDCLVIEYACTGNSGRSPLAEAIGNEHSMDRGILNDILAISSGTKRDANMGSKSVPSINNQLFVMGRAISRNDELRIYSSSEAREIANMLSNPDTTKQSYGSDSGMYAAVRHLDTLGRTRLIEEEHEFRARAAKEIGLSIPIKQDGQQTIACDKVDFFYAMDESNERDAKTMYEGKTFQPPFSNFGISNTFGLPYDEYRTMVDGLKEVVIETIDTIYMENERSEN